MNDTVVKWLWNRPHEARHGAEESRYGGPEERSLHEAVKMRPGLFWRSQDVRDARVMVQLTRRAEEREWNQAKEIGYRQQCWKV